MASSCKSVSEFCFRAIFMYTLFIHVYLISIPYFDIHVYLISTSCRPYFESLFRIFMYTLFWADFLRFRVFPLSVSSTAARWRSHGLQADLTVVHVQLC